jgi:hypothetical protein
MSNIVSHLSSTYLAQLSDRVWSSFLLAVTRYVPFHVQPIAPHTVLTMDAPKMVLLCRPLIEREAAMPVNDMDRAGTGAYKTKQGHTIYLLHTIELYTNAIMLATIQGRRIRDRIAPLTLRRLLSRHNCTENRKQCTHLVRWQPREHSQRRDYV